MTPSARGLLASALVAGAMVGCGEAAPPPAEEPPAEKVEKVDVPDVTGEDADSASSTLEDEGFEVAFEREGPDDPTLCTVENQDPSRYAEPGTEVTLSLTCEAPDVTGETVDDATTTLKDAGYSAKVRPKVDDTARCSVEKQDPTGEVELGETIVIRHDCVEVPDVVGMRAELARDEIEVNGDLTASFDIAPEDPAACTVESQHPEGTVTNGEYVVLTLDCPGGEAGY
jgi:beta-lactam-binding protein with PASTA domain